MSEPSASPRKGLSADNDQHGRKSEEERGEERRGEERRRGERRGEKRKELE